MSGGLTRQHDRRGDSAFSWPTCQRFACARRRSHTWGPGRRRPGGRRVNRASASDSGNGGSGYASCRRLCKHPDEPGPVYKKEAPLMPLAVAMLLFGGQVAGEPG